MQPISTDFIKDGFEKYGPLEKIEIFSDDHSKTKFTHVTFKQSQTAYLALLDCIGNLSIINIVCIQPADMHLQPDNPVDSSTSQFYNLPDNSLLAIANFCNVNTRAMLSTVCKKFSELLSTRVFAATSQFNLFATNDTEIGNALLTASRLVQCINPPGFHLKIFRDLQNSVKWPKIVVDVNSPMEKISVEMNFFKSKWLAHLHKIVKRIKSIHLRLTINDEAVFDQFSGETFPNATEFTITGYSIRCDIPDLTPVITTLPKLEAISLRDGTVGWDHVINYCQHAKNLRNIGFQNCCFDSTMNGEQIAQIAHVIKNADKYSRLGLIFDRIQTITSNDSASTCGSVFESCSCVSESKIDPTEILSYGSIKEVLNSNVELAR